MTDKITWRKLITESMSLVEESWGDVISCTLSDADLDIGFNDYRGVGLSRIECEPFLLWTDSRVYFPEVSCCAGTWVSSVPRNPNNGTMGYICGRGGF